MNTMRKAKRTYKLGRPITGWAYGKRIKTAKQVKVGYILIGDSHQFKATNLYRVISVNAYPYIGPPFHVEYIAPNRRREGYDMAVWLFENSAFYLAHRQ